MQDLKIHCANFLATTPKGVQEDAEHRAEFYRIMAHAVAKFSLAEVVVMLEVRRHTVMRWMSREWSMGIDKRYGYVSVIGQAAHKQVVASNKAAQLAIRSHNFAIRLAERLNEMNQCEGATVLASDLCVVNAILGPSNYRVKATLCQGETLAGFEVVTHPDAKPLPM